MTRPRLKPYSSRGIKRVPCLKCGEPSHHQWNICSLGGAYHGICIPCDIALNDLVLAFFDIPDREAISARYAATQNGA